MTNDSMFKKLYEWILIFAKLWRPKIRWKNDTKKI